MPGDWDGGWRRAAPPLLTLSRAPLGVSDGLAFRSGLAAWQNPSFDSGMGHALLPTAPTGLVHGATRRATPRTTDSGGGPLLLRAVRADGTPEASSHAPAAPDSGTAARPSPGGRGTAAPSSPGGTRGTAMASGGRSASGRPASRDLSLTTSPAVLSPPEPAAVQRAAAPAGGGGTPATAPAPLVRRVAVVPVAPRTHETPAPRTREASAPRPASGAPARTTATATGAARELSPRVKGGARGSTAREGSTASGARVAPGGGRPEPSSPPVVRPRPVGAPLTVARRVPGSARPVPALRPAAPAAPPRQDRATPATDALPATAPGRAEPTGTAAPDPASPSPAVQRAAARTVLGAPLTELPSTASTTPTSGIPSPAPGGGGVQGPGLPLVQRQAEGTSRDTSGASASDPVSPGRPGARARGGLGAPLSAMPPSATPPAGSTGSGARPGRPAPGPGVQRAPASPAGERPSPAAPEAPLLGATDVQRRLTDHPASPAADRTDRTSGGAPVVRTPGSAAPPSGSAPQRAASRDAVRPHPASGGSGSTAPVPVVVARAVSGPGTQASGAAPGSGGDRSGTAGPPPTPGPASATGSKSTAGSKPPAGPQTGTGPKPITAVRTAGGPSPSGTVGASGTPGTGPRPTAGSASRVGTGGGRPAFAPYLGSAANGPVPVARRTLALLPARPLTLSTGAADGLAPSAASRAVSGPPVVAARWNTARDAPGGPAPASAPGGGTSAPVQRAVSASVRGSGTASAPRAAAPTRGFPASGSVPPPSTRPDAPGPFAAPTVQRAATAPGPWHADGGAATGAPAAGARVPVVTPAPPGGGASAAPARSLPVAPPQAPPVAHGPSAPGTPAPGAPVPVVRPRSVPPAAASTGGGAAPRIQRAVPDTGGSASAAPAVPVKAVSARGKQASSAAPAAAGRGTGRTTGRDAEPAQDPGLDLDDLARRLLDPMARLLRTELRRGRERSGRPFDGRR
ncbi:hypothetical protein ACF09E_14320 [Streptomyces sp. NPDC014891]|uniref:hypothetical protein n=1 Tax=Streptomyces sp. NPDC014891 TaxID=3364929 RepID=UPI0036FE20A4